MKDNILEKSDEVNLNLKCMWHISQGLLTFVYTNIYLVGTNWEKWT